MKTIKEGLNKLDGVDNTDLNQLLKDATRKAHPDVPMDKIAAAVGEVTDFVTEGKSLKWLAFKMVLKVLKPYLIFLGIILLLTFGGCMAVFS
jgi:hypothetical protein